MLNDSLQRQFSVLFVSIFQSLALQMYKIKLNSLFMFFSSYSTLQPQPPDPSSDALRHKVNTIARLNLKEEDKDICACEECIYRRQLNRRSPIGLDLSKRTSYRKSYQHRSLSINDSNNRYLIDPEKLSQEKRNHPAVVDSSIYLTNFRERSQEKVVRNRPTDELKFKGPVQGISSYNRSYFAFRNNANPYIKPVETFIPNPSKMKLESIYKSNYNGITSAKTESGKQADHLKSGLPWTGGSTYRLLFGAPQNKPILDSIDLSQKNIGQSKDIKASRTLEHLNNSIVSKEGNFKHQYQTTYRHEFLESRKKCGKGSGEQSRLLESLQF